MHILHSCFVPVHLFFIHDVLNISELPFENTVHPFAIIKFQLISMCEWDFSCVNTHKEFLLFVSSDIVNLHNSVILSIMKF